MAILTGFTPISVPNLGSSATSGISNAFSMFDSISNRLSKAINTIQENNTNQANKELYQAVLANPEAGIKAAIESVKNPGNLSTGALSNAQALAASKLRMDEDLYKFNSQKNATAYNMALRAAYDIGDRAAYNSLLNAPPEKVLSSDIEKYNWLNRESTQADIAYKRAQAAKLAEDAGIDQVRFALRQQAIPSNVLYTNELVDDLSAQLGLSKSTIKKGILKYGNGLSGGNPGDIDQVNAALTQSPASMRTLDSDALSDKGIPTDITVPKTLTLYDTSSSSNSKETSSKAKSSNFSKSIELSSPELTPIIENNSSVQTPQQQTQKQSNTPSINSVSDNTVNKPFSLSSAVNALNVENPTSGNYASSLERISNQKNKLDLSNATASLDNRGLVSPSEETTSKENSTSKLKDQYSTIVAALDKNNNQAALIRSKVERFVATRFRENLEKLPKEKQEEAFNSLVDLYLKSNNTVLSPEERESYRKLSEENSYLQNKKNDIEEQGSTLDALELANDKVNTLDILKARSPELFTGSNIATGSTPVDFSTAVERNSPASNNSISSTNRTGVSYITPNSSENAFLNSISQRDSKSITSDVMGDIENLERQNIQEYKEKTLSNKVDDALQGILQNNIQNVVREREINAAKLGAYFRPQTGSLFYGGLAVPEESSFSKAIANEKTKASSSAVSEHMSLSDKIKAQSSELDFISGVLSNQDALNKVYNSISPTLSNEDKQAVNNILEERALSLKDAITANENQQAINAAKMNDADVRNAYDISSLTSDIEAFEKNPLALKNTVDNLASSKVGNTIQGIKNLAQDITKQVENSNPEFSVYQNDLANNNVTLYRTMQDYAKNVGIQAVVAQFQQGYSNNNVNNFDVNELQETTQSAAEYMDGITGVGTKYENIPREILAGILTRSIKRDTSIIGWSDFTYSKSDIKNQLDNALKTFGTRQGNLEYKNWIAQVDDLKNFSKTIENQGKLYENSLQHYYKAITYLNTLETAQSANTTGKPSKFYQTTLKSAKNTIEYYKNQLAIYSNNLDRSAQILINANGSMDKKKNE